MNIQNPFKTRKKSFEALIQPHLTPMYYQAYRLLHNQADAEDLVHDFVLRLYANNTKISNIENLRIWLYKGLYRQFLNHLRAKSRNPMGYLDDQESDEIETTYQHELSPEFLMHQDADINQANAALQTLPQHHHDIILMHDIEGFTLSEISNVLDCPVGTLKSRLHRARNSLKNHLMMEPFTQNQCVKS